MKIFGEFRLDTGNHILMRGQERIPLAPKPFDILRYLVYRPARLITQDELLDALWPETYVQPEVLRKYILELRRALGDEPQAPRFIQTLPKRGYRFVAPVHEASRSAGQASLSASTSATVVGRSSAVAQLSASLAEAERGKRQILFLTGEAGIGKTTLLDAWEEGLRFRGGVAVARGQCVEGYGGKEPYYPVLEALSNLAADPALKLRDTLAAIAPTWLQQLPALQAPGDREALAAAVFGASRERMVREIADALESLAKGIAVVILLEDAHWVDPSTLDLISALARRRAAASLMIVASYRPVDVILSSSPLKDLKQDLVLRKLAQEIALERLEETDVNAYLAARFGAGAVPATIAGRVYQHSDGNPLFLSLIADRMEELGRFDQSIGIPDTLQQMMESQFDPLPVEEAEILTAASAAGGEFTEWAISTMIGRADAGALCSRLAHRMQFLLRGADKTLPDGRVTRCFEFRHALFREFLYRRLPHQSRLDLHHRLAAAMEAMPQARDRAAEIALHFEAAEDFDKAVHYCGLAGDNCSAVCAHLEAIALWRHALELPGGHRLESKLRSKIGDASYSAGDFMTACAEFDAAAEAARRGHNREDEFEAARGATRGLVLIDPELCLTLCDRLAGAGPGYWGPQLAARSRVVAASWRIPLNGWDPAEAAAADEAIRNTGVKPEDRLLYSHLLWCQARFEEALAYGSVAPGQPISFWEYSASLTSRAIAMEHLGDMGGAYRLLNESLELAARNGNLPWVALLQGSIAWLFIQVFEYRQALERCDAVLSSGVFLISEARTLIDLARAFALMGLGDPGRAIETFRGAARELGSKRKFLFHWYWRSVAALGLASALSLAGDLQSAAEEADRLLSDVLRTSDATLQMLVLELRSRLALASGDHAQAGARIEQALHLAAAHHIPTADWRVYATAAQLGLDRVTNRDKARASIFLIADSFGAGHPLREGFLSSAPVQAALT